MSTGPEGRSVGVGRRTAALACALLVACGAALVAWVLTHQTSAPQAQLVSAAQAQHEAGRAGGGSGGSGGPGGSGGSGPTGGPTATPTHTPTPSTAPSKHHAASTPSTSSTPSPTPSHHQGLPRSRPVRVVIPSIDVTSTLQQLGTNPDGSVEVPAPPHYNEAGWYTGSPTPGQVGPAVILGHIDGVGTTPSVFFKLGAVQPGDHVKVHRADGRTLTFTVYRVERYAKDDFPTGVVYGNTPGPELRLITCGGTVNPDTGHYRDNTVVYARMTHVTR